METLDHQARGYKAALHNSNVSDEAKEHARQALDDIYKEKEGKEEEGKEEEGKDPDNVARGLKATQANPRVSEEAKENAEKKLEHMGVEFEE